MWLMGKRGDVCLLEWVNEGNRWWGMVDIMYFRWNDVLVLVVCWEIVGFFLF